jgi:NADPH:quinone reductase-like Zn-dependent oxidoreductase
VEIRRGDYFGYDSLVTALADVERLMLVSTHVFTDRNTQHFNAIAAAKQAGVRHIVFTGEDLIERGGAERIVTIADPPVAAALGVTFSAGDVQDRTLPELAKLADQVASGEITVALSRTFTLADAAAAHELVESGHPGGKILIDPS